MCKFDSCIHFVLLLVGISHQDLSELKDKLKNIQTLLLYVFFSMNNMTVTNSSVINNKSR